MPKIVEKKAWYQMSDEEKAEYDAKVQAEVDASGGKLKKRRKRRLKLNLKFGQALMYFKDKKGERKRDEFYSLYQRLSR